MIRQHVSVLLLLSGVAAVGVTSTQGGHGVVAAAGIAAAAAPSLPTKIGSQIAGSFADATGHSGQSHLVYAANAGIWWLFTLSSAHDSFNDHTVRSYYSSGPNLATATWTAGAPSPHLANAGTTDAVFAGGRSLGAAVLSIGSADYAHVFASAAYDGQVSSNGHIRAQLGATSITWGTWNNPGSPNAASEWQGPAGTGNSGAASHSSWGNVIGISTGGFIHHSSVTMDQEVDCNVGRSTTADTAATWTNGFGSNTSPTGVAGFSPPWTTAVIDKSMTFECKSLAFAPLASNVMLAVYSNGAVAQPNLTNLRFQKSGANGTWANIPVSGGGNGNVFSTNATIDSNDWSLVPVSTTAIYTFRRNAAGTGVDGASYVAASNTWTAMSPAPPPFGTGQALKNGAGLFGAHDGSAIWLFVVSTDAANSILYSRYDGTAWSSWAAVPGTDSGTHARRFISGAPVVAAGQVGLIWTEGAGPYDVFTASLTTVADVTPPAATFSVAPASIASGQPATLSWSTTNATTIAINQGIGTVAASGTRSVSPTATTTYTLTATNAAGSATATAAVTVTAAPRTTPTITWSTPASIVYGTALSATQLNATTTVPGTWAYAPAAGTVLAAGAGQTLSVTFTPADTASYTPATATVAITVLNAAPGSYPLLQQSDLIYEGAFRLPAGATDQTTLAYGGFAMAYNPARNSLYMNGHIYYQKTAELSIPTITNSASLSALSTATLLQPLTDITEGRLPTVGAGKVYIGGQMVHGGRLVGSAYTQDDTNQAASHFTSGLNLSASGDFQGFYKVGAVGARFVSGYMTQIPAEWQTALGGTALTGGCCNPPNLGAVNIASMPWGPAAFVFNPDNLGTVTPVPATPVVYYSESHPTLGSWSNRTTPNPAFNLMTEVTGVVFPQRSQSVLFFGKTGTSAPCFGNGTNDPAMDRQPWPGGGSGAVYCYDPNEVNGGAGPHAYPYAYYVWAYNAQDFVDVKNGLKNPWDITPYGQWTLTLPFDNARRHIFGAAYDPQTGRIFISQLYGDANGMPVIHVYKLPASGSLTPTATISASPASISSGQSATLSWNTTNATTVAINQGIGSVAASGTRSVIPTATTTYTLTATNSAGSAAATATVTVTAGGRTTPTITWSTPVSIIYGTALSGTQLNATTTVPGSWAYSPAAGVVLAAGARTLSVTFNPTDTVTYNSAIATAAITVLKATPLITWPTPAAISSGTPLGATQLNATANAPGAFTYTPPSGTVLGVGAGQQLSASFAPASTANYNGASRTVPITVNGTPTTGHNAARANSYDDAWQGGASGWVANAKAILAGGAGQAGLVLWLGDSLTRDPALGAWAQRGAGKTAADQMITNWMHAGLSSQSIDSIDGFALATPYICAARSYTVGDGLGAWDFMGSSMPPDTNPATARLKLQNCAAYPNALNLTTMLSALPKGQFAIPEVNLDAANPGVFTDLQRMVDMMIANHIVPIILTYTYRTDATFNGLVDRYNTALVAYAQAKKLPLIDFNKEMLARLPFAQWPGRFLSDGVHYTRGTTTYPSTSDPYANGGDPATHTTGLALTYNGYGLKGWLGVQKMKEIKQLVIDGVPTTLPTVTMSASPSSITSGASSTLTWSSTDATSVSIDQTIGTVTASGTRSVTPASTTSYIVTATNAAGSVTATATVTVTIAPTPDTTPPTITTMTPAAGATGVGTATTLKATFSEPMNAGSVTAVTFVLRNPANAVLTATVAYNATTRIATLTPSQPLSASTSYTATITGGSAGVKDVAGNALASNYVASFTTSASTPLRIWSASAAPSTFATTDSSSVELGVKFRSDAAGTVTGVRFYKGATNTGTHTGTLWTSTGTMLATATFTGETASGWQTVTFSSPVAITANTVYVVSYHTNVGNYAYTHNTFALAGVDSGPLHALQAGVSGGNGVFRYGGVAFPTTSFNSSNYWVDVVFVTQ